MGSTSNRGRNFFRWGERELELAILAHPAITFRVRTPATRASQLFSFSGSTADLPRVAVEVGVGGTIKE
ncbi:MAG: hypothetical protein Aurels2KO_42910 [Aureliella sp.]